MRKILPVVALYLTKWQIGNDPYSYKEKYPEDVTYEGMRNARVWRTYEDVNRSHGASIVDKSREKVDVLLVFVSL